MKVEKKWISIRMWDSEIAKIDQFRTELIEDYGVRVSRNQFLRDLIFNNLDYQAKRLNEASS
jgi:hypothetical protein